MFCFSCGAEEPEYKVNGYLRVCGDCKESSVMTVMEMIELVGDLKLKGLLPISYLEDFTDEDFKAMELDFDDDADSIKRAYMDARKAYKEGLFDD
jgi:hypothetical protein